jgi:hypothetical protein
MDVCDAVEEADDDDHAMPELPEHLLQRIAQIKDIESAMLEFDRDLKYPVDVAGRVLMMNYLPDVPHALAYHFIRCGWRKDPAKQMVKQRKINGPGVPEDLVAYVAMDQPDEPVVIPQDPTPAVDPRVWSVRPKFNDAYEERTE